MRNGIFRTGSENDGGKRNAVLMCLVLAVVTIAVYVHVGSHGFINIDDPGYVTENPHIVGGITGRNIVWAFTSFDQANWHPVTWLSHMMDVQLYGLSPQGHHLTSVYIHTVSAILLFILLLRLTGAQYQSLFVAAMFALHPLHVESVAWVAERKDVLSAFFGFLSLLFYSQYAKNKSAATYVFALSSFLLGLMSKPMLVTLPVVMLLIDFWPLNRYGTDEETGENHLRFKRLAALVSEKSPFLIFSIISCIITICGQHKAIINYFSPVFRIENTLVSYVKYIIKIIWPSDMAVLYPMPPSIPIWQVFSSVCVLVIFSSVAVKCRRRYPYIAVGWFWFIITLVPVIGIIQVGSQAMADRYSYIPATGLFIIAAWGFSDLTKGIRCRHAVLSLLAGIAVCTSAALTRQQVGYWQNNATLYRHTLQVTTGNEIIHYNLGNYFHSEGDLNSAVFEYKETLQINPNNEGAHINLGIIYRNSGNLNQAIQEFQEALQINPDNAYAHNNLGLSLSDTGNLDQAIKEYQEAIRKAPNQSAIHYNLGLALAGKGDLRGAIVHYKEALTISPNDSEVRKDLEAALAQQRRIRTD